jgi:hypothetical protein
MWREVGDHPPIALILATCEGGFGRHLMVALYEPDRESWRGLAACRNAPGGAETFHPYGEKGARAALSYCAAAP